MVGKRCRLAHDHLMVFPLHPVLREGPFRGSLAVAENLVTPNQLRSGRFVRLVRDVYVPTGTVVTHELRCIAAAMIIPPTAAITGRSAATASGIPLAEAWDPVEVVVPEKERFVSARDLVVRRVVSSTVDATRHRDGLILAAPERMCFDLTVARRLEDAVAGVDAVLHRGLTDAAALSRFLTCSHERGVRHARRVLELSDERAESPPESVVRVLLVRDGLRPVPQCEIRDARGFVARVDLGFEEEKVGVEYEGRWHGVPQQVPLDRWRLNRIHAAGWRIVFVTAPQLRSDRAGIVDEVRTALLRSARLRALAAS